MEEQEAKKMSQYELELKLDRMTQRAYESSTQRPPKKPLSIVDAEIIKEYQKQFNEPIREYELEIDEETGEEKIKLDLEGKPKFKLITKKFRVTPPPELEVVESYKAYIIPTDEEKEEMYKEIDKMKNIIDRGNIELKELLDEKKLGYKIIDELPLPTKYVERLDYDKIKKQVMDRIRELDIEIEDLIKGIAEFGEHYNTLVSEYQNIDTYKSFNDAEVAKVKQINKERIKAYQENLNLMNKGAFQQDQMPNETEEDYLERLQANAEEEYIIETQYEANMEIKRKFKEALKKLIRDDAKIEQVANSIKDIDIEIKNEILKKFPLFKRKFIEIYGLNNPSVEANDIKTFIDAFIKSSKGEDSLLNYLERKETEYSVEKAEQDKSKVLIITNPLNKRKLYWRLGRYYDDDGEEINIALWSISGKRETYDEYLPRRDNKTIKKETGITAEYLKQYFENKPPSVMLMGRIEPSGEYDLDFPIAKEPIGENEFKIGWGIKEEEIPELVDFGKIKLALNKLFYKNILSVRHNNTGRIAGFPNVKVSDALVNIIMKIAKGEKVLKQEIDSLQKTEQILYDKLLSLANLHKKNPNNREETIKSLKERMELISGSIDAGNDNEALVKELYGIVKALKSFGVITNKEAIKYLSQF